MNRAQQPAAPARSTIGSAAPVGGGTGKSRKAWNGSPMWLRAAWIVLLFAGTGLAVALVVLVYFGGPKEANYIDKTKEQAVFLTNGQVYFGKISAVNHQYLALQNIFYLNVNQQVQPDQKGSNSQQQQQSSIQLVKLGCELHGPVDRMIINRDQVTFWENLKTDGQVAQAIGKWAQQNPQGQQCPTPSTQSNSNSGSKQ